MIFFLLLLLFFAVTMMMGSSKPASQEIKVICPPHRWATNTQTDSLECFICGFKAGTYKTEGGDY